MNDGTCISCCIILFIAGIFYAMVSGSCNEIRERQNRSLCASNLKQLGTALKLYSSSYNDKFPGGPGMQGGNTAAYATDGAMGATGLELLRSNDFLADYGVYICPSTVTSAGTGTVALSYGAHSTDKNTNATYAFVGGLIDGNSDIWGRADSAVAADFVGNEPGVNVGINGGKSNHTNFGNILYLAGNVSDFKGAGWFNTTNTGYPNIEKDLTIRYCPIVPNGIRKADGKPTTIFNAGALQ
jgi:hypothetical protein